MKSRLHQIEITNSKAFRKFILDLTKKPETVLTQ